MAVTDVSLSSSSADALIPVNERREILKGIPAQSAVLSLARRANMSTKKERQPVLEALPQAYWVSTGGLKQTTKAEWGRKELVAEELAVIVPMFEEHLDDSDFDLWGEYRPLIVEALGVKLDQACLFANDQPAGFNDAVVPDAIAAGNTVSVGDGSDLADDLNLVMGEVEGDGYDVNGFAARKRVKGRLRGLRDANGGLLFNPSLQAGTPSSLYGESVRFSDANGAWRSEGVDVIAGDWTKAVVGVRQDITFKVFTEGVISDADGKVVLNLMQQDAAALRVVARYGFAVANPINRMNEVEANRYPFAVLETSEGS